MTTYSVILPTYDRADLLPRALDSALAQTVDDLEVIVVDDGSTDDTSAVVEGYEDDRIISVRREENAGPSAARNAGLAAASGEYVTFLDSDDEFAPTLLERSLRALRDDPACAGTCVTYEIREDGDVRENRVPPTMDGTDVLLDGTPRVGGMLLRSGVASAIGGFDEGQPYNEDVDYWIRLFRRGYYLVGIDEPLYRYYKHGAQQTVDPEAIVAGLERFFAKHDPVLPDDFRAQYRRKLAKTHAERGEVSAAAAEFGRAIGAARGPSKLYYCYLAAKLCSGGCRPRRALATLYERVSTL